MKFIDHVTVTVRAGDGGNGRLSFRHEKFVDRGGPDGGDGGNGGDVVFVASRNQNTLVSFRYHKELAAEAGGAGDKVRRHGKNGKDLRVEVPVGTLVTNAEGQTLADLTEDGQEAIVASGGRGGFGNAHFISSTRQAPKFAEKGEAGEEAELILELKLIADVGLVGLPNAGKSTLLSVISNARPEIADYPFTTLTPNLGVVDINRESSLLFADIPGLIEGAAEGKGLGDEFLRHVERTAVLLHLVDAASADVAADYQTIQHELATYRSNLATKKQIVVLSKIDLTRPEELAKKQKQLKTVLPVDITLFAISSQAHENLQQLLYAVQATVEAERQRQTAEEPAESTVPVLRLNDQGRWHVSRRGDDEFIVSGHKIERFAVRTDFDNEEGIRRLRAIMTKQGIMHELRRQGIRPGNRIHIAGGSFEY
ncbi:MAG TPA: GTPase ObgE [Candidatus Saccharimonadales bacterium]|nr:GTPase ObgE [Candidatus Saccharimonadales bacterium]